MRSFVWSRGRSRVRHFVRTRIKICGITRPEDAEFAAAAGADAIGLVFCAASPRAVTIQQAQAITARVPPFVSVVGVFADDDPDEIREILQAVRIDILQFHGEETPENCRMFDKPYLKAVRMRPDSHLEAVAREFPHACGLLLDTYSERAAGGTGEIFDWARVPAGLGKPLVLAGGLTPDNVASAIASVGPYAVDVSSGVERAKGVKDADKIEAFVRAVQGC